MTYRFIQAHRQQWPIRLMCDVLDVCPAGYYAWRDRTVSIQQQRRDVLAVHVQAIHQEFKGRYGSPRIHAELVGGGHPCCVNTVAKLMRDHGIRARSARKFRVTTDSNHGLPIAENLLERRFNPSAANEVWLADITYIATREGWLYLAVVEDLYSRMAVGWSMAEPMTSRLVVDALQKKARDHLL